MNGRSTGRELLGAAAAGKTAAATSIGIEASFNRERKTVNYHPADTRRNSMKTLLAALPGIHILSEDLQGDKSMLQSRLFCAPIVSAALMLIGTGQRAYGQG